MRSSVLAILFFTVLAFSISSVTVVLEGDRNVIVLDTGNPLKPKIVQHYTEKSPVYGITLYGRIVYVNTGKKITILKLDHNADIAFKEYRAFPVNVEDFDIKDGKALVVSGKRVLILDDDLKIVSNLLLPWDVKKVKFFDEDHALLSVGKYGVVMVDLSNLEDPKWIWRLESKDGEDVVSIDVSDRYAYCLGKKGLVFVIDLKDPEKPRVVSYTRVFPIAKKIVHSANRLFVLSSGKSLEVVDISDIFKPFLKFRYESDKEIVDFYAIGSIVYLSKPDGFYVMKMSDGSLSMIDYSPAVVPKMFAKVSEVGAVGLNPGEIIWTYNAGSEIRSSPAVFDGRVYFAGMSGSVFSLDVKGDFLWNFRTKFLVSSAPVVDKLGRIVFGSWDNYVYVLDESGKLLWRFRTGGDITRPVAIDGKRIYVGSEDGKLYALEDGKLVWKLDLNGWLSTNIVIDSDGVLYFGTSSGEFYSVSYSGNILWTFEAGGWISSGVAMDLEGNLYFGSVDDYLYVLDRKGELLWKYNVGSDVTSGPVLDSFGKVLVGTASGNLVALSRKGDLLWIFPTNGKIRSTPAVSKEGFVYFGSDDGNLYSLNPDGSLRWKLLTGDKVISSPVVLKNIVMFGSSDGKFYAVFDETGGLDDGPWPMCCGNENHNKIM